MAIKCLHSDHSSTDDQVKYQKTQAEEDQKFKESEGADNAGVLYVLPHLKHDWYQKGEVVVVHLYIKNFIMLDTVLYEDEIQVKFSTRNEAFLKMYSGTSEKTLFSWNLLLSEKVDLETSKSRTSKAIIELSLKKTTPNRWPGLTPPHIPENIKDSNSSIDRPFKQLVKIPNSDTVSLSKEPMTNGIHENSNSEENTEAALPNESTKSIPMEDKENVGEEVAARPEEKLLQGGHAETLKESDCPLTSGSFVSENPCNSCETSDRESANLDFAEECIPGAVDSDDLTENCDTKTGPQSQPQAKDSVIRTPYVHTDSSNGQVTLDKPVEKEETEQDMYSQVQHVAGTSTAESLTTSFSTLSTSVQPSTSTSTLPSVSPFDSNFSSAGEGTIPPPPPIPPPPSSHTPAVRGYSDGQVKTRVMGGNNSNINHLPFSDAIKAAASKGTSSSSFDDDDDDDYYSDQELSYVGLTGLENLGNTCYLNSIIQCLANTRPLRDFFLYEQFKEDINTENPLGTGGRLALIFADLMRNLWSGKDRSLSPYKLKGIVGEKVCQFKGFMQQDAQEFMAFLLDGLHEDLNRVKKKPYVEEVEGAGRPDTEVANEAWRRYKSRNDSVIVDLFQGQLKSKLTCPVCKKISIKYDPFMNLSVPLPKDQKKLPVYIFFKDYNKVPLKIGVKIALGASIEQFKCAVERFTGIQPDNMRVYEVFSGKFHRAFDNATSLSSVMSTDIIVVYEVLSEEEAGEPVYEVPIIQRTVCPRVVPSHCASCYKHPGHNETLRRCTQCWGIGYCNMQCQKDHWTTHKKTCKRVPQPIGLPFVISIPASKATFKRLQVMAEEYAKYSVIVQPGDSSPPTSPTNVDKSTPSEDSGVTCVVGPPKGNVPKFYVKPVTAFGDAVIGQEGNRLSDEGSKPLDLGNKYFSIDWRNHPRSPEFVDVVEKRDWDFVEHSSYKSGMITESYSCSLNQCLELFTEPETLSENDAWGLNMSNFTLGKDDNEESLYDLFAAANHSGAVSFGHYTAFGRLAEADHPTTELGRDGLGWRYFDDRHVTETHEERVVSKYAYVLFYKRRPTVKDFVKQVKRPKQDVDSNMESLEDVDENELD
ncbi:Ubiquitin carboxyl-terminal hydrolase 19 [Stylophora pistillata]|uniref:ubiquitinyl hydrolase 1 n=1 Tax=Stylophora pistillata TaxID=50429 RepID=A0A2B4SGP7_STYPI|nr:Ubiquitin carboxyl-terminal hydrolase 19 [Stylophora pistillata]